MESHAAMRVAWPSRYELLDGLRGVAALVVVLNHLDVVSSNAGHFAVMVFFVISGYCITASAASCRRNGIGLKEFMWRRAHRIYPPYLLAILFFAATRLIKTALGGPNALQRPALEWIQNLTLTQWLSDLVHPVISPVQNPTLFVVAFWSLNYEEQFYLVMAAMLALSMWRRLSLLFPIIILAIIGLGWNWIIPGNWICGLFIEYWAHFALGACLFFVLSESTDPRIRYAFIASLVILGAACTIRVAMFAGDPSEALRAMIELSFLSAVTLALLFLRPFSHRMSLSVVWRPLAALGTISYSLYLIQQFNLTLVAFLATRLIPARSPHAVMILVQVGLFLALAALFWWFCERPFLRRRSRAGPVAAGISPEARPA
jgi:peptidoglycan/LPS O-acetylase OafA/YrhL